MAELADAPDLGSGGLPVQVQVLLPAPSLNSLNLFTVGKMFGLFLFLNLKIEFVLFMSNKISFLYTRNSQRRQRCGAGSTRKRVCYHPPTRSTSRRKLEIFEN